MQRKGPLRGKIFARCIPERRFAGLFGYMARISCHRQLISDTWRRYVAMNWRFSRPRPFQGCMKRKTCHRRAPGRASREHFAIGERRGMYQGMILPRLGARAECPAPRLPFGPRRRTPPPHVSTCPTLILPPCPPRHYGAMRRTWCFCRR